MAFRTDWKKNSPTFSHTLDLSERNRKIIEKEEGRLGGEGTARDIKQQRKSEGT